MEKCCSNCSTYSNWEGVETITIKDLKSGDFITSTDGNKYILIERDVINLDTFDMIDTIENFQSDIAKVERVNNVGTSLFVIRMKTVDNLGAYLGYKVIFNGEKYKIQQEIEVYKKKISELTKKLANL